MKLKQLLKEITINNPGNAINLEYKGTAKEAMEKLNTSGFLSISGLSLSNGKSNELYSHKIKKAFLQHDILEGKYYISINMVNGISLEDYYKLINRLESSNGLVILSPPEGDGEEDDDDLYNRDFNFTIDVNKSYVKVYLNGYQINQNF